MNRYLSLIFILVFLMGACSQKKSNPESTTSLSDNNADTLILEGERHFKHLRQLTFGGDNAEAYWSFDDSKLVFIKNKPLMVSTGLGRTTCSYFLPGDSLIIYASTHGGDKNCPPKPEPRTDGKYVWPIYSDFDIYIADLNGNILQQLTDEPGYDAEATVSPKGDKIVFTSIRTGDLELYTMNLDGTDVIQITDELGYDGGAFFSPDGSKLIFRASRPKTQEAIDEYKQLLEEGLVKPTEMELFICNTDGTELKQITNLGQANWCPFFHPSGEKVIFASNHTSQRGFPFNLYMINTDGSGMEQITTDGIFDAFPVFSNNGKYLVFSSNRNNGGTRDTNLFIAEWMD
jgi:Tol biopolymer transport system component